MSGEPLPQLGGIGLQALEALGFFLRQAGFEGQAICFTMALEHDLSGGFQFVGLVFEVGAGAALLFAGITGQFDAINSKHLAPDQALPVAQIENLAENVSDVIGETGNKSRNGSEVRLAIAGQSDEDDVMTTDSLNVAARDNALA